MKRLLYSIAAVASLFSAGCCCDNWCNMCNPCGRSSCCSPCASPCGSPCSNGSCGAATYGGPTSYAPPINGTAYIAPGGTPFASTGGIVNGPITQTAATMPLESLQTY